MRLRELHVDGFGKLSGLACDMDAPVTIVYGPNEAGKSTMLGFVRAMLFGFANRGNLTERREPVNGGRHGGRLTFEDGAGRTYVAERHASAPGKVQVREAETDGAGLAETLTQAQWERRYLGGVGERIFRELFAITLTELQAIGMLEGDELGRQLYHAGWSGGGAIAGAEKRLQGELDELFRPRGSNQRMNKLLKSLEEKEEELRRLEDGIDAFNAATADIAAAEVALAEAERGLGPLRERSALLARAAELRESWLARSALLRERETLADAPRFAADARSRWEALTAELRRAGEEVREAEEQAAVLEGRLERLGFDAELLARKADIESLLLSAEQIAAARQSASELQAEAAEHGEAAKGLLRRISPAWTEAALLGFQAGVAEREAVRVHRAALQDAEKALGLADAEHRAASEREREAAAQLDEPRREAAGPDGIGQAEAGGAWSAEAGGEALAAIFRLQPQTEDALRYAARGFEEAWRELELAELREGHEAEAEAAGAEARAGRFGGGVLAYGAAAIALAAGAAALAAAGQSAAAAAVGAAALALAAPALLRLARRSRRRPGRVARAAAPPAAGAAAAAEQRALAALGALVAAPGDALALLRPRARAGAAAAAARREAAAARDGAGAGRGQALRGGDAAGPARLLARLRAAIDARQDELRALADGAARRAELARAHARLRARAEAAGAAADAAALAADAAAAAWRDWLTERALPPALSPEAAMETLDLAEQARLRLEARERAAGKAARLRDEVAAFERSADALAAAFPEPASRARGDAAAALRLLQAEADGQAARRAEREALREKQAEAGVRLEGLARRMEELRARQERWFAAGGVANELAWLAALERSERLAEVEQELFRLNATVTAGLSEAEQARLDVWLSELDEAALRAESAGAERAWREAEAERGRQLELLGRARQRLEQLLRDGDRQRLIGEREAVAAALEALIDRYAVLAVSMTMIRRTKRMMEEQRQPAVLREASRLMNRLTEGRYNRIQLREDVGAIALEAADGRMVESGFLSRGAAEQLYLAMRFALADEAAAARALPLLLDDPFVNFDRDRQRAAADVLGELAERRQIVFFTCHDSMSELLLERIPAAKLVELAR